MLVVVRTSEKEAPETAAELDTQANSSRRIQQDDALAARTIAADTWDDDRIGAAVVVNSSSWPYTVRHSDSSSTHHTRLIQYIAVVEQPYFPVGCFHSCSPSCTHSEAGICLDSHR